MSIRDTFGENVVLTDKVIISDQLKRIEMLLVSNDQQQAAIVSILSEIHELLRYWSMKQ